MKICVAQTKSEIGNIKVNIENHLRWITHAVTEKTDLIVFPELSLLGYEPKLAKALATDQNDMKLEVFQEISDANSIAIGLGLPIRSVSGILIGMVIFQPHQPRRTYFKQILHSDEKRYFIEGSNQPILALEDAKIALAICYESLQPQHLENAYTMGATVYLASVAKSQLGIEKANAYFPTVASKYSIPVLMANCVGYCDDFTCAGQSSIWNAQGNLIGQLNSQSEGLLLYDTVTKTAHQINQAQ